MEDKILLAQYLYDIAKKSKSEFIEISKDSELIKVAEKMNLVIPSPDIAILKTIYAEVDKPNRNNIILPKEAAKKAIPTLIGKQANWSHLGKNHICGWILDAKLEKDLIVTYIAIYKSLFSEEFEKMKEMVKENKMAVSFEIWNRDEKGNTVLHDLGNGIKSIDPIIYHGVGILIEGETPACPKAYAEKLLAIFNIKELEKSEKYIDNNFEENLVYASLAVETPKCKNCDNCQCEKEGNVMDLEKTKEVEKTEEKPAETEVKSEETKTQEIPVVAETKTEETKVEVKAEEQKVEEKIEPEVTKEVAQPLEQIEPKIIVKVTSIYSEIRIDTYVDGTPSGTQEVKGLNKKITEYKDGTKDEVEEVVEIKKKFDFAEVEEKVNAAKAEKDVEIATLKVSQEKEVADLKTANEELDKEIKKLKDELGQKDQEIAELKTPKVEEPKEKILSVGTVKNETAYHKIQEEVNEKAFGKKR